MSITGHHDSRFGGRGRLRRQQVELAGGAQPDGSGYNFLEKIPAAGSCFMLVHRDSLRSPRSLFETIRYSVSEFENPLLDFRRFVVGHDSHQVTSFAENQALPIEPRAIAQRGRLGVSCRLRFEDIRRRRRRSLMV